MPAARRQEIAARSRRMGRRDVVQLDEALELRASSQGAIPSAGGGDGPRYFPGSDVPVVGEVGPSCSGLAAPVAAAPVPLAAPAPAQRDESGQRALAKLCASRRQHLDAAARGLRVPMNVIGKECLHDSEANLSAAYGKVIAAIAGGCVNCAARREAISEVMRVHRRVLRTSDHVT